MGPRQVVIGAAALAYAVFLARYSHPEASIERVAAPPAPGYETIDLAGYNGEEGSQAGGGLLLAILGRVFNVTTGAEFYAPKQSYRVFAGKDCTRSLALTSTKAKHVGKGLDNLTDAQLARMNESYWDTYIVKYPIIGVLLDPPYNPAEYDKFAGPFADVGAIIAAGSQRQSAAAGATASRGRESRCPVTRAAKAVVSAVTSLIPRLLLGGPA